MGAIIYSQSLSVNVYTYVDLIMNTINIQYDLITAGNKCFISSYFINLYALCYAITMQT